MSNPTGRYLCSDKTLEKARIYLNLLQTGALKPSRNLRMTQATASQTFQDLEKVKPIDFIALTPEKLIELLMNTRLPKIFAEREARIDGVGWNLQETEILGDISFSTTNTHAYNNGGHYGRHVDHKILPDVHFLFTSGALFANGADDPTPDMLKILVRNEITKKYEFDEEAYYESYENRLLPGLLAQNEQAKKDGVPLVINIPGLGCESFAGGYKKQIQAALPRALRRLFEKHGTKLDMVRAVNYDPYEPPVKDEFTTDKIPDTQIKLMCRPLTGLPKGAPGEVASQLEFPKDGTDYTNHRLIKIVAWDPFSFPGNDIWENIGKQANGRKTDDGVSFASSDVILALFNMGQFSSDSLRPVEEVSYNSRHGIVYPVIVKDGIKERVGYEELSKTYKSHVSTAMIEVIPIPGAAKLEKTTIVAPIQSDQSKKDLPSEMPVLNSAPVKEQEAKPLSSASSQKFDTFIVDKEAIQKRFMQHLQELNVALQACSKSDASINDARGNLCTNLTLCQNEFFKVLTPQTTKQELELAINNFRESCSKHLEQADSVMGHGWLYRIAEVVIKAVVGLFAGIGMVLGCFFGQGLLKEEHRQKYAQTFFTLNQTEASQALNQFKGKVLGDGTENLGLLSLSVKL